MVTVVEKLFENADRHPDKLAVIFEGEEVSYGELRDAVIRLASWFKLQGVTVGDRIVVQAAFCKWYLAACYAAHLCGAIFVPIEKNVTGETLRSVIERMGAKTVISRFTPEHVVSLNYQDIDAVLEVTEEQPWEFPAEDLVANIMLTSGTTGPQKGAMVTQKNLVLRIFVKTHEMDMKENDVGITFIPLNHVGSTAMFDAAIYNGSTYIFLDGVLKLRKFYEYIEKYHVNMFNMPPSGVMALEQLSQNKLHDYASQVDCAYIHASPIQEPQRKFLKQMLPQSRLFYSYGSSENGLISLLRFDRDKKDIRCTGKPCEGVNIKILDESLNESPQGEQGRVAIQTEMNFKGYWDMPELTENVYHGGYYLSNDAGYLDEEGFLHILGRIDDVINVGGLKVHPSEIENAAMEIVGIEECICYDVPHTLTGFAPKLLVREKEGIQLSAREIRSALMGKLDTYKIPVAIEIVPEIAKTFNGKPDRKYYRLKEKAQS